MIISVTDTVCGIGSAFMKEITRRGHEASDGSSVDLGDTVRLRKRLREIHPDAVIHCREDLADDLRCTENLARACKEIGAQLMLISSAEVYGSKGIFSESDVPKPESAFGKKMFACEHRVAGICGSGYIMRLPDMVFGQGGDMDIVDAILAEGAVSSDLTADHTVKRCAVCISDAAELGVDIIENGRSGIFNCVNEGTFTMFAFTCEVFRLARLAGHGSYYNITVSPSGDAEDSLLISSAAIRNAGIEPLEDWHMALERCIASLEPI